MKKHYAQKDADGILTQTIHTSEAMESPWFEITQECVCSGMVWDDDLGEFVEPAE